MGTNLQILLVEDNSADVHLTLAALRDSHAVYNVQVAEDGEQALKILRRELPFGDVARPHFIILDLNMPRLDGRELLPVLKADANLRDIPVIVMSGSANPVDVAWAYQNQAACYITKPIQLDEYFGAVRALKQLWFHAVAFPTSTDAASAKLP